MYKDMSRYDWEIFIILKKMYLWYIVIRMYVQ